MIGELAASAVLACLIAGSLGTLALVALVGDHLYGRWHASRTPRRVTPASDWRDQVQDFIGGTGWTRTAAALARSNTEGRTAGTAGPRTTHGGQRDHESFHAQ